MSAALELPCYVAGRAAQAARKLAVHYPYTGELVGTVPLLGVTELNAAIEAALAGGPAPTRYHRHAVLEKARHLLEARSEAFAQLIRQESGLCIRETRYEVTRALDVLMFAALESLREDGQIFDCDTSPRSKARKIFTTREPLRLVAAITPFNHPLNQVAHKLAPAIAAGAPVVLKPSEKTPLTAIRFVELLYEAGLPPWMLSVVLGPLDELVEPLVRDERVELVTFTGSAAVGKHIAATAGYKKLCLELGGHSPLIVLDDADLELAAKLAAEGCFRNSGQRCTAVRRLLIQESVVADFTARFLAETAAYSCADPADPETRMGTVINEQAAKQLEEMIHNTVAAGGRVIAGGARRGAQLEPTVMDNVPRTARIAHCEAFGPLAPIFPVRDLDDAIALSNATPYGLSCGIVTTKMESAIRAIKGIRAGTINVNEVPGFRIECSPFGGVKDSGLGIKEGVIEAMKFMSTVKTFSLPW